MENLNSFAELNKFHYKLGSICTLGYTFKFHRLETFHMIGSNKFFNQEWGLILGFGTCYYHWSLESV